MNILPAIDLMEGTCVRLTQGQFSTSTFYTYSPSFLAELFERMGYTWLHIIDLDGARLGTPQHMGIIQDVVARTGLQVQVGGGIRSLETISNYLHRGVRRVIVSSLAVYQPEIVARAVKTFGTGRIVVAMDVKNDHVQIAGWTEEAPLTPSEFVKRIVDCGVSTILCTDVLRDGMMNGPNIQLYQCLMKEFPKITWIAAGGVATARDKENLEKIGVKNAVIGKAFYEGSTLMRRIIPCLDVQNGRVVKGVQFKGLEDCGDPVELGKMYADAGADELVFLDITASKEKRGTTIQMVRKIAEKIFIPFTVGGGIRTIEDVDALLHAGADKVSLNTAAAFKPALISEAARRFGSQAVVVAIDAKKKSGRWGVFVKSGSEYTGLDAVQWACEVEKLGAGEILLTSMDRDGTKKGFDVELLREVSTRVKIPVIASGGAGSLKDFKDAFVEGRADAVLAASLFHKNTVSLKKVKQYLSENNIPIRI